MTDKDNLNPNDFLDEDKVDSVDGKNDDTDDSTDKSTSTDDDENAKTQNSKDEDNKSQKRDLNKDASFAEKRREKERKEREEREAKIKEEAKIEGKIEALKVNPFTNEKIVDAEDLKIYEIQKKLDDEGLDPISDLPKRLAEINRKEREKQKSLEEEKAKIEQGLKKDIEDFKKAYPDVDLSTLGNDEEYLKFAEGKIGRWTTAEIYEAYKAKKEKNSAEDKKAMTEKNADDVSKQMTKTPSSSTSGKLPPKSVENMTKEEFKEYWKKKYGE